MAKRIHKAADTQTMDLNNAIIGITLSIGGKTVGKGEYVVEKQTSKAGKTYHAASLKAKGSRFGVQGVAELDDGSELTFGGSNVFVQLPHADYSAKPATAAPNIDIAAIVAQAVAAAMAAKS